MTKKQQHQLELSQRRMSGQLSQCRSKTWDGQRESKRSQSKRKCRDNGRTRRGWE